MLKIDRPHQLGVVYLFTIKKYKDNIKSYLYIFYIKIMDKQIVILDISGYCSIIKPLIKNIIKNNNFSPIVEIELLEYLLTISLLNVFTLPVIFSRNNLFEKLIDNDIRYVSEKIIFNSLNTSFFKELENREILVHYNTYSLILKAI